MMVSRRFREEQSRSRPFCFPNRKPFVERLEERSLLSGLADWADVLADPMTLAGVRPVALVAGLLPVTNAVPSQLPGSVNGSAVPATAVGLLPTAGAAPRGASVQPRDTDERVSDKRLGTPAPRMEPTAPVSPALVLAPGPRPDDPTRPPSPERPGAKPDVETSAPPVQENPLQRLEPRRPRHFGAPSEGDSQPPAPAPPPPMQQETRPPNSDDDSAPPPPPRPPQESEREGAPKPPAYRLTLPLPQEAIGRLPMEEVPSGVLPSVMPNQESLVSGSLREIAQAAAWKSLHLLENLAGNFSAAKGWPALDGATVSESGNNSGSTPMLSAVTGQVVGNPLGRPAVATKPATEVQGVGVLLLTASPRTWDRLTFAEEAAPLGPTSGPLAHAWNESEPPLAGQTAGLLTPFGRSGSEWLSPTQAEALMPLSGEETAETDLFYAAANAAESPTWEGGTALTAGGGGGWQALAVGTGSALVRTGGPGGGTASSGGLFEENRTPWGLLFSPALFLFTTPKRYQATILLVEHDEPTRDTFHALLAEQGYLVLAAGTAHDALGVLRAPLAPVDLVLLDTHLPDVSGLLLYARLRELHPDLPVVVCTHGEFDPVDLANFRELGAPFYLSKPVAQERLLATIQAVLR